MNLLPDVNKKQSSILNKTTIKYVYEKMNNASRRNLRDDLQSKAVKTTTEKYTLDVCFLLAAFQTLFESHSQLLSAWNIYTK